MVLWARVLVLAVAIGFSTPGFAKSPYQEGVQLYNDADYAGALEAFTRALDRAKARKQQARVYVYIGLIQVQFGSTGDAVGSFKRALSYDADVAVPRSTPKHVRSLFRNLRASAKKAQTPPKPKPKPKKKKRPPRKKVKRPPKPPEVQPRPKTRPSPKTQPGPKTKPKRNPNTLPTPTKRDDPPPKTDRDPKKDSNGDDGSGATQPSKGSPPDLNLPPKGPSGPEVVVAPVEPAPSGLQIGAWVSTGVGAAAIIAGIVLTAVSQSTNQSALDETIANRAFDLHESAKTQQTLSFVAYGIGGAALGTGIVLFTMD